MHEQMNVHQRVLIRLQTHVRRAIVVLCPVGGRVPGRSGRRT